MGPDGAPSVLNGTVDTIAVVVLLAEFAMLRSTLLRSQIRLYAAQSFVVAVLAAVLAFADNSYELLILAALSIGLKVIAVPVVMSRTVRRAGADVAGAGSLRAASSALIALVAAGFGFFAVGRLGLQAHGLSPTVLAVAGAIIMVAFVLMTVRTDVVSQSVGFFSLENGVSVASLVVAAGMPLILEVAFLFDLLVAVVVFGVLIRVHHAEQGSLSTSDITALRG